MHCMKGGDIREFLGNLSYKKEALAAAGVHIMEMEHECTILHSIPSKLATFTSTILTAQSTSSTDIYALVNNICEEADQLKLWHTKGQGSQGGKEATDEALAATDSEGRRKRRKGKCHNCGKPGHWARECCSPKKETGVSAGMQATQAPSTPFKPENKPVGSANAVVPYDFEGDGFWMAVEEAVDEDLMRIVGTEPDPLLGASDECTNVWHWEMEEADKDLAHIISTEPAPLLGPPDEHEYAIEWHPEAEEAEAEEDLTHIVGAKPDPLLGTSDECNDSWHSEEEEAVEEVLMCIVSTEPDLLLGAPEKGAIAWDSKRGKVLGFGPEQEIEVGHVITPADDGEDGHICSELYDSGMTQPTTSCQSDPAKPSPLIPPVFLNTDNWEQVGCIPMHATSLPKPKPNVGM